MFIKKIFTYYLVLIINLFPNYSLGNDKVLKEPHQKNKQEILKIIKNTEKLLDQENHLSNKFLNLFDKKPNKNIKIISQNLLKKIADLKKSINDNEKISKIEYAMIREIIQLFNTNLFPTTVNSELNFSSKITKNIYALYQKIYDSYATAIPKELHFIWLGGNLGGIEKDYILLWRKLNPDYKINIWYDPKSLFVNKTKSEIKKFINQNNPNISEEKKADMIIELQNKLFNKFKSLKNPTDSQRINFLIENKILDENLLSINEEKLHYEFHNDIKKLTKKNITLRDINDFQERPNFKNYFKEMNQRMNLAAASDIIRLEILNKYGGVYLDVDILPSVRNTFKIFQNKIFINQAEHNRSILDIAIYETIFNNIRILDSREKSEKALLLNELALSQQNKDILSNSFKEFAEEIKSLPIDKIFNTIEEIRIVKDEFLITFSNNNIIATHKSESKHSLILTAIDIVYNNYDLVNQYEINGQIANMEPEKQYSLNRTKNVERYRYDGLLLGSQVTLEISGPEVYIKTLQNHYGCNMLGNLNKFIESVQIYNLSDTFNPATEEKENSTWLYQPEPLPLKQPSTKYGTINIEIPC